MNFLQRCKRSGGFTLVELIVVIAILAILAGVAVPAYTGYIKKAEEAADNQLLAAVNTAFAAACLENGVDAKTLAGAELDTATTADGTVINGIKSITYTTTARASGAASDEEVAKYTAAFNRYYAGNTGSVFKVFTAFDFADGAFTGRAGAAKTFTWNGQTFTVPETFVSTWKDSANLADIGTDELLNKVDTATKFAYDLMGSTNINGEYKYYDALTGSEYMTAMAASMDYTLNMTPIGTDDDGNPIFDEQTTKFMADLDAMQLTKAEALAKADGVTLNDSNKAQYMNEASQHIFANNAVLTAAAGTKTDATALLADVKAGLGAADINAMKDGDTSTLSTAAAIYVMYTAYANTDEGKAQNAGMDMNSGLANALTSVQTDTYFQAYLETEEAKTDLAAYLSAIDTINSNVQGDPDIAQTLLINGFGDADLATLLKDVVS